MNSPRPPSPRPLRVLLVEDDPSHLYLQRHALERGTRHTPAPEVTHATTLAQARRALESAAFDAVLLDLELPDSSGLGTVDAVREVEGGAAIVVLTSLQDEDTALAALSRGAQDYLLKRELDPERLSRALRYAVERKTAAGERATRDRLQATLDSLSTHVAVLDHDGRIVLVNEAWRTFATSNEYGDTAAGLGASYVEVCERAAGMGDGTAGEVAAAIRAVSRGEAEWWEGEYPCHSPTEERYFVVRITRSRDPELAVVVAHENVTPARLAERERLQIQAELRESLERYDLVQRATNDTLWDWDVARGTLTWSHEITRTFGYPPQAVEPTMEWWTSRIHPDERDTVVRGFEAAMASRESWTREYRFRRANGTYAVVLDRCFVQRDAAGSVVRIIGSMQDVSEHRRLMAAVEQSEAHYRSLVTHSPQTIYALDMVGRFTEINPAGTQLLQRPADDLLGRHYHDVVLPADRAAADRTFVAMMNGRAAMMQMEVSIVRPGGETRRVSLDVAPIREGGVLVGVHGTARDLTEERAREGQMRILTAALENLAESVSVLDEAGTIVYSNPAHARMMRYPPGAPPEEGVRVFFPNDEARVELEEVMEHLRDHGSWSGRVMRQRLDGQVIPLEMRLTRVEQGGRPLVFVMSRDVTDEVEREQRLRRAERLASMGTLVSGVAHELNNPLASIMGFTQLLLMDERPAAEREDLETIRRETERMAKVVADLRLLGRGGDDARTRVLVDLNDVARHVLRSRAYAMSTHNVQVRQELAPGGVQVLGDRGQLEQVVLNLVVNAEQAVAAGGGERRLVLRTAFVAGGGVSLCVGDTGPGMEPALVERIFDPFFTTKPPGEGTGLGLSVVARIVAEHGGEVRVESTAGRGTAFTVELPAAPAGAALAEAHAAPAPAAEPPRVRPLRVLVVDDEAPVRRVVARFLERRGHQVDEAAEGAQALAMVDAAGADGYAVILSDLRMPGLGGDQLLERLRARGQGLDRRLVFLTGDTASADAERILRDSDVPVLEKPIDMNELARVLEEITHHSFTLPG